jgi:hypothetical protein
LVAESNVVLPPVVAVKHVGTDRFRNIDVFGPVERRPDTHINIRDSLAVLVDD